jgi:predicted nuclease of restriction endonuclease-like (RecB) superfamily
MNQQYQQLLSDIKRTIQQERNQAIRQLNRSLIAVYWEVGRLIVERQAAHGWGKGIVEQLSSDLRREYPGESGYSARNLWDMRRLYDTYKEYPNLRQVVAEIPWGQHLVIMQRAGTHEERLYYLQATAQMAWSRDVLLNQIKAQAYQRQQLQPKQNNFAQTLPEHIAEQANEMVKSSYSLEFLGINEPVLELQLERQLIARLKDFLLELGYGFSFVGNQYPLKLSDKTYYVDLLFFHRRLRCLVAIDLKIGAFRPEYAGKMNFHLELLDGQVRLPEENPSIGIILCAEKDQLEVEYALRTSNKPLGVAEYQLMPFLPEELNGQLPSPDDLKQNLSPAT